MATPMPIETTETGTPPTDPVKVVKPRGEVSSATEDGSSSSSRSLRAREREPTVTMRDASSPFFRPSTSSPKECSARSERASTTSR
eukprot:scaffold201926_cov32-Tisochrysis_lutea.AAC.1